MPQYTENRIYLPLFNINLESWLLAQLHFGGILKINCRCQVFTLISHGFPLHHFNSRFLLEGILMHFLAMVSSTTRILVPFIFWISTFHQMYSLQSFRFLFPLLDDNLLYRNFVAWYNPIWTFLLLLPMCLGSSSGSLWQFLQHLFSNTAWFQVLGLDIWFIVILRLLPK